MDINVQWCQVKNYHPEASEKISTMLGHLCLQNHKKVREEESTYSLEVSTKMATLKRVQSLNVWFSYLEN